MAQAHASFDPPYRLPQHGEPPRGAIAAGERAIALNPNYADGYALLAFSLSITGKPEEALLLVQHALRLNPHPWYFYFSSLAFWPTI